MKLLFDPETGCLDHIYIQTTAQPKTRKVPLVAPPKPPASFRPAKEDYPELFAGAKEAGFEAGRADQKAKRGPRVWVNSRGVVCGEPDAAFASPNAVLLHWVRGYERGYRYCQPLRV